MYGILRKAYQAFIKADEAEKKQKKKEYIEIRMEEIEEIEEDYNDVAKFKKEHKGNLDKKKETIKQFTKE